ncbi:MAG: DUF3179 domain-containing (seleno)protein [Planctomycetota bacterium]
MPHLYRTLPLLLVCAFTLVGCGKKAERLNWERQLDKEEEFTRIHYSGGVFLEDEYNLDGLAIPIEDIHTLLGRDEVPPITETELVPASEADWVPEGDRIAVARIGGKVVGTSFRVMYYREIANLTVGDDHVAITYCPLCDSVAVFSRVVQGEEGPRVVEFGTSGALYNHNLLMYDREELGLWTQMNLTAVSGAHVGTKLSPRPVEVLSHEEFLSQYPDALLVSFSGEPIFEDEYAQYFTSDNLMVPVREYSDALPIKTLGIGIATDEKAWFVPRDEITDSMTVETDAGAVEIESREGVLRVVSAPEGVRTLQAFFYAWSLTFPESEIVQVDTPEVASIDPESDKTESDKTEPETPAISEPKVSEAE